MSNKIKLSKKKKQKYKKVKRPAKISMKMHIGDLAGCGHIRVIIPSLLLNTYYNPKEKLQFECMYSNRYNPDARSYKNDTFVTFQRSSTKEQLQCIQHFKSQNPQKPIFWECDDDLFNIPEWNFAHPFYAKNGDIIKQIISEFTGCTVSTPYLKKLYSPYNKNIRVIPNHLPKFIWGDSAFKEQKHNKVRICYPGSFNHFDATSNKGDFDQSLIDFIENTTDKYQWVFVGGIPLQLKNNKDIESYGWQTVFEYPNFIKNLDVDIMLAPLEDNEFNKSKSNIKALEATALGIPLICSNIEPYNNLPGICDTTEYMIHQIEMLSLSEDKREEMYNEQYKVLKNQLYWEDNNNILKYVDIHLKLINISL